MAKELRVIAPIVPAGDFEVANAKDIKAGDKRLDVALAEAAAEVAKKANKTDVNNELNKKASTEYVNAELSKKADKADVAAELVTKANKIDTETALAGKASVEGLASANEAIADLSTEQAALSARMDTFTRLEEGSTTGDAELADGRVGADGKTYTNIGGAIRGQVTDLKSDLTRYKIALGESWETASGTVELSAFYKKTSPNTPVELSTYNALTIEVNEATKAKITGGLRSNAFNVAICMFLDDSYSLIGSVGDGGADEIVYSDELVSIPVGTAYLRLSSQNSLGYCSVKLNKITFSIDDFEETKDDLSYVENIIGKEETYSEPSGTREVGFYSISKFNTLTYQSTYSSITYPVGKSTKAKVTAVTNIEKGFSAVLFLDDSYGLVSHALDWNESEAVTYIDELISIPQNASYIRIVGHTKTGINPIAKLNNTTLGTRLDDIESDINKLKESDNPHKDDVWVCFGDSITGKYTTPCIPDMIAERFGCTVYNVGFSGTRAVKRISTAYQYFDFQAIADAVVSGDFSLQDANVGETVSSYVERLNTLKSIDFSKVTHAYFFYGTNDFNGSQTIVSMKNALIDGISRILTAYPNITPVIITPMFRFKVVDGTVVFLDDSTWVAYEDKTLVSYINGVEEVGNENYIPVINLLKTLGITKYNYTKWFNISDGTHPSEEGIKLVGKVIAEQLYILF